VASDKTNGVMAEYSAEYTEWQRQLAREKLDRDRFEAEQATRRESEDALVTSAQRKALLDRCKSVPSYTRIHTPVEPFESVTACIEVLIEAWSVFRTLHAENEPSRSVTPDVVRSEYERRLLAMLEAGLVSLVEPATMLPWSGNPERSNVNDLLLAREEFVLFARYQGIEVCSPESASADGSTDLNEVGEKSWTFVYATMAALAHLSGLKPHKIASSVVAVLEGTNYPVSESTVRKYFDQIKARGIVPKGEIPVRNYSKHPIRGGSNDAED
jgi:hypothetical protein